MNEHLEQNIPVITIDGPSGVGKGTICQLLTQKLGWHFLDSGAIYRVLAYASLQQGVAAEDVPGLVKLAESLALEFVAAEAGQDAKILLSNQEISKEIRDPACGAVASKVSAHLPVREALLARQRAFRQWPGLIADGRDMGTVVFPDANVKIFMDADPEERAKRRLKQLQARGINVSLAQILTELIARDKRDRQRSVSPLVPAEDAHLVDTTHLSIDEVMASIMALLQEEALVANEAL